MLDSSTIAYYNYSKAHIVDQQMPSVLMFWQRLPLLVAVYLMHVCIRTRNWECSYLHVGNRCKVLFKAPVVYKYVFYRRVCEQNKRHPNKKDVKP